MRMRRWIEGISLSITKSQFSHELVYKLMKAVNQVHRSHTWTWARRDFIFTTQARFVSLAISWQGIAGQNIIQTGGAGGDIGCEWTGAEILIVSAAGTTHARIVRIGVDDDQTYAEEIIELDQPLAVTHAAGAQVTVFRREYSPRTPIGASDSYPADTLTGDLRRRDITDVSDDIVHVDSTEFFRDYGAGYHSVTDGTGRPSVYTTGPNARIPAPKFAPVVTSNAAVGTKVPLAAGGNIYLACAYEDLKSGVRGPIGPITLEVLPPASVLGYSLVVEYGNTDGVPEESYRLLLLVSPIAPVGFDGEAPEDKDFRINESMIPFSVYDSHPRDVTTNGAGARGGGAFKAVLIDEDLFRGPRWFPWDDQMIIRFLEVPTFALDYVIPGKVRHPWMNWIDDEPLVPEEFQDAVELAVRASINGQEGLLAERRFQFVMKQLRQKDFKRSNSSTQRHSRRSNMPRHFDRYGIGG